MNFNPAAFAIRRWQFTMVVFLLLIALGLNAFLTLPRMEDPSLDPPVLVINAVLPGATPTEIEQLITKPVENTLYKLDDIREVRSQSRNAISTTRVEFIWGTDPEKAYEQVSREINALRPTLPMGMQRLEVIRARPLAVSVIQIGLVSDTLPVRNLERLADKLREHLGAIPGVSDARYWGATPSEVRVALDPARMAAHGVVPGQVLQALRAAGSEAPLSPVEAGGRRFEIQHDGAFSDTARIGRVAVTGNGEAVLHVRDVARVAWATGEPDHITRFNGKRALLLTLSQGKGQDVNRISRDVTTALDAFERTLPGGVKLVRGFDQSHNVNARLGMLGRDFLIALALVLLTLLPLGTRAAIVVMVAIPSSLLLGMLGLKAFGYTLNQVSISGFVVALGLLVDDAIVVVENIARWLREGASRTEAAIQGTRQITLAVLGCTACLMLSFVPLLALPEGPGEFVRALPVAVLSTVGASLLVALTLTPLLAAVLLKRQDGPEHNRLLEWVQRGIQHFYAPVLRKSLDRPVLALSLLLGLTLLTVPLVISIGASLFPPAETPQFLVRIETPKGTTLERTDAVVKAVEKHLSSLPEVAWYSANAGRGNPQIFYNVAQRELDSAFGEIAVSLHRWEPGKSEQLLESIRSAFAQYPGAKISIVTFMNGPDIEAPIAVRISGPDVNTLAMLAGKAERAMQDTPGVRDVANPLRQQLSTVKLNVDEVAAAALGVPAGAIRESLQMSLTGVAAANFRGPDGYDYPVKVRLPMAAHNDIGQLSQVYIPSTGGSSVQLSAIARPTIASQAPRIDRIRRERVVTLTANVAPRFLNGQVTSAVLANVEAALSLPPGYSISLGGEAEVQSRSFAGFLPAILIASLGILAILILEFGRFRTVGVVFGIVPFGIFGAVLALWCTGQSLSFMAMIGLIALIGIEIKNSILLVDFTEQLCEQGMPIRQAIERAGEVRFLPVLLTSVTAIGGLLPLALENNGLLSPTAIVLIGGLLASTLLARIATPVMYLLLSQRHAGEPA
ncbi:MAG: efflux RND transporter permease subunit [Moraxellaceae bacterium]